MKEAKVALIRLRTIEKTKFTDQDALAVKKSLSILIAAMNQLINSSNLSEVLDELEKFLSFYVDCFQAFNKTQNRLPWLNELSLKDFGAFEDKLSSPSDVRRAVIYRSIISLFYEGAKAEKKQKEKPKDDAQVKQAFKLYDRAFRIAPAPIAQAQPELPSVIAAAPPVQVQQSSAIPVSFSIFKPASPVYAMKFTSDASRRAEIIRLIDVGDDEKAVGIHPYMVNCTVDDYRRARDCEDRIGGAYFAKEEFELAVERYKFALRLCKQSREEDVNDDDRERTASIFNALVKAINAIIQSKKIRLEQSRPCAQNFLEFYDEISPALAKRGLPGLNGLNIYALRALGLDVNSAAEPEQKHRRVGEDEDSNNSQPVLSRYGLELPAARAGEELEPAVYSSPSLANSD